MDKTIPVTLIPPRDNDVYLFFYVLAGVQSENFYKSVEDALEHAQRVIKKQKLNNVDISVHELEQGYGPSFSADEIIELLKFKAMSADTEFYIYEGWLENVLPSHKQELEQRLNKALREWHDVFGYKPIEYIEKPEIRYYHYSNGVLRQYVD